MASADSMPADAGQSLAKPGPGSGTGRSNAQDSRSNHVGFTVKSARILQVPASLCSSGSRCGVVRGWDEGVSRRAVRHYRAAAGD